MEVAAIIDQCARHLQDTAFVRWPSDVLVEYLNTGVKRLVSIVPNEFEAAETVQLKAGARQSVPSDSAAILQVVRNRGPDGSSDGALVREVDRKTLDMINPGWRRRTGRAVKEWMRLSDRRAYEVNPPVSGDVAVYVEIRHVKYPDAGTYAGSIDVPERYESALVSWVLANALTEDSEDANFTKGNGFYEDFYRAVGGVDGTG